MPRTRLALLGDMHLKDEASFALFDDVLEAIDAEEPDRLVIMGDMTNDGAPELVEGIAARIDRLSFPTTIVPGNHDLGNVGDYGRLTRFFGDVGSPGPLARSFDIGSCRGIVLDTNNTIPDPDQWHGVVEPDNLRAFELELAEAGRGRPLLLFAHAGLVGKESELTLEVSNAADVLERLRGYDLRTAFHGHAHILRLHRWEGIPFLFVPHLQQVPGYLICSMRDDECDVRYQMVAV